ncbi:MAG: translocation/assembly module TamB domain-containing protein [Myxococcota bacterium]
MSRTAPHRTVQAADPDRDGGRGRRRRWRQRRDWGGLVARLSCVAFAVLGLLPLAAGALIRVDAVQRWAADHTAALVARQFGVEATYRLELRPWPLVLSIDDLEVPASDGGAPFLRARHVTARPRIFSLLAGKLDLGAVEVVEPQLRAVVRGGELRNLSYRLPSARAPVDDEPSALPLSSASVTDGRFDVTVEGVRVRSEAVDLDVNLRRSGAERPALPSGHAVDITLRGGRTEVDHRHPSPADPRWERLEEDALCGIALRASLDDQVLIRRLEIHGAIDLDPNEGTRPPCEVSDADWRKLDVTLESVALRLGETGVPDSVDGRVAVRLPVPVVHRFVDIAPTSGWVALDLEALRFDPEQRLPQARGVLRGARLGIDSKIVARYLQSDLVVAADRVALRDVRVGWAEGDFRIADVTVDPFAEGITLAARELEGTGVTLPGILADLSAHPRAHVGWNLASTRVETFGGTLDPLELSGPMTVETNTFAIYDRPAEADDKRTFMRVDQGRVAGEFRVQPDAIVLNGFVADTGRSRVQTTVSLGYDNGLSVRVFDGSFVDLVDVSPLVDIPLSGIARLEAEAFGPNDDPIINGKVTIDDFRFAGFPLGTVTSDALRFVPLALELRDATVDKGDSRILVPRFRLAFDDADADVLLETEVDTEAPGAKLRLPDFLAMTGILPEAAAEDAGGPPPAFNPSWREVDGYVRGRARARYVLGGRRDRCGTGSLEVGAKLGVRDLHLFGLDYDQGRVDVDFRWDDTAASDRGMVVDVHSGVLRKGSGTIVARGTLRPGAEVQADVIGTAIPLRELTAFREAFDLGREVAADAANAGRAADDDDDGDGDGQRRPRGLAPEAKLSFVAAVAGQLDALRAEADIDLSPLRIGPDVLPASRFRLHIEPGPRVRRSLGRTACGQSIPPPFDPAVYAADAPQGVFRLSGSLFGGQVEVDDFEITRQRAPIASGRLLVERMDLGALANVLPGVAFSSRAPTGWLSAEVTVDELPLQEPGLAEVRIRLDGAEMTRGGATLRVPRVTEPLSLSGDALRVPVVPMELQFASGLRAELTTEGTVAHLSRTPDLDLAVALAPSDLGNLGVDLPSVTRAAGRVEARLDIRGTVDAPRLVGRLGLQDGMIRVDGLPVGLDDVDLELDVRGNEVRVRRASARSGNTGRLALSGRVPLDGLDMRGGDLVLVVTDLKVPVADGVELTADARLRIGLPAPGPTSSGEEPRPSITGRITLKQFSYTRPISFRLDLDSITGRGATEVETYDPAGDLFDFDVLVVSPQPVRVSNNLLEMRIDVESPGLRIAGTNQRYGAQGELTLQPGSRLFLQGNDFTVRDGTVSFDNDTRIAPRLDVHATTIYRRYAAAADDTSTVAAGAAGGTVGGRWRIMMHAFGDTDAPEVRFTSDPPLSQEDIVLLLQIGMTRAELDRGLLGSLAQTVGLEALSAAIGLDEAVRSTVPLIDEFRVGSQYSSRTGRPEPTITLGKRISDRLRATVATSLGEEQEIRSSIEYRFRSGVTVQGGYDNVNDVSSSILGNVGAGLRWRLEFE